MSLLKTYLEIGPKLAIIGGFAIFTLHCIYIQRLPEADLPTLIDSVWCSCVFFVLLLLGTGLLAIFPPLFIRDMLHIRCGSTQDRNKPAYWPLFARRRYSLLLRHLLVSD